MLELGILAGLILWGHLRIRSEPIRIRRKLLHSIDVYAHLKAERNQLLLTMKPHKSPALVNTLTHLDKRLVHLASFVATLHTEYMRLYRDPYARVLLRLPAPPEFTP